MHIPAGDIDLLVRFIGGAKVSQLADNMSDIHEGLLERASGENQNQSANCAN